MTLLELQQKIADALSGVEEIVKGGCKVFAEDSMTVYDDLAKAVVQSGSVGVCVVTPSLAKAGCDDGAVSYDISLKIQCSEKPGLNRKHHGHITALDAALVVAEALDGDQFGLVDIRQSVDERTGTLYATAAFDLTARLSVKLKV